MNNSERNRTAFAELQLEDIERSRNEKQNQIDKMEIDTSSVEGVNLVTKEKEGCLASVQSSKKRSAANVNKLNNQAGICIAVGQQENWPVSKTISTESAKNPIARPLLPTNQQNQGKNIINNNNDSNVALSVRGRTVLTGQGSQSASSIQRNLLQVPVKSPFYRTPGGFVTLRRRQSMLAANCRFDLFKRVPDEVLLNIFSFLQHKPTLIRCALTCQRFSRIAMDSSLWTRIDFGGKCIEESTVHRVMSRGVEVMRLARADLTEDMTREVAVLLYPQLNASKLTYLDLSMSIYESADLIAGILQRCSRLQALSLEFGKVNERACVAIGQNPELTQLNMAMCEGLTAECLSYIIQGCPLIEELNLSWTGLSRAHIHLLVNQLPSTITRLNISGIRQNDQLLNEDIENLVVTCKNLIELDVSDTPTITEEALVTLIRELPDLKVLCTSRCYGIQPVTYMCCGKLDNLRIFGCVTEEGYVVLRSRLPKTQINDEPFSTVARPTVGIRRTSIWQHRVRDDIC